MTNRFNIWEKMLTSFGEKTPAGKCEKGCDSAAKAEAAEASL